MAEFLYRRINVAIPEVDVGDDVFVVKGTDAAVTRVQVKAATAKEQNDSFFASINVPLDQLSVPQDTPSLVYVFPIRHRNRWSDFIVIRRSTLFAIHTDGAGSRFVDDKGNMQVQFRIVFRETTAKCGPAGGGRLPAIPRCLGAMAATTAYQCPYTGPGQPCARTVSDRCPRGRVRGRLSATVRWLEARHVAAGTKYYMTAGSAS